MTHKKTELERTQNNEIGVSIDTTTKVKIDDAPTIENVMYVSLDGKWFIHKTIITDIKPINYMKKVFDDDTEAD